MLLLQSGGGDAGGDSAGYARLASASSRDALIVTGGADGGLSVYLKPADVGEATPAAGGGVRSSTGVLTSPYDLPAAACLPLLFLASAHSDAIWGVAQAPPGYPLTRLLAAAGVTAAAAIAIAAAPRSSHGEAAGGTNHSPLSSPPSGDGEGLSLSSPAPTVLTSTSVPIFATASADGTVKAWCICRQPAGPPDTTEAPGKQLQLQRAPFTASLVCVASRRLVLPHPAPGASATSASSPPPPLAERASCIAFDPTAPSLVALVGTASGAVLRVDLETGDVSVVYGGASPPPGALAATSAADGRSGASSPSSPPPLPPLRGVVRCLVHPVLPCLFVAYPDRVAVLHSRSGRRMHEVAAPHQAELTSAAVDPGGLMLVTSGNDGDVRVWSVETRACVWTTKAHKARFDEAALCVAFHPTRGALMASGGGDGVVRVYCAAPPPPQLATSSSAVSTSVGREGGADAVPGALEDGPVGQAPATKAAATTSSNSASTAASLAGTRGGGDGHGEGGGGGGGGSSAAASDAADAATLLERAGEG